MNDLQKIGLGTAAIGRPEYINIRQKPNHEFSLPSFKLRGREVLNAAYAEGIRYFDTAPGYGMAEQLLLDWLVEKNDESIEIATKWGYTYVANFDPKAIQHEVKEHSINKLEEQWEQSKSLPFLTTYQIHSATFETGVLENETILNRLAELKEKNNLLIGLTTTGYNQVEVLKKALDIEVEKKTLFDVFQVTYNVFDQSLAMLANQFSTTNKRLIIKEALANGRIFPNKTYPNYKKAYSQLNRLAEKYNVGVDAIALRFCIDSMPIYKVLSGVINKLHLLDNIKTTTFKLTAQEISLLISLAVDPKQYWQERKQLNWN